MFREIQFSVLQRLVKTNENSLLVINLHRCQPPRNRAGNPAFCLPSHIPAFLALFRKQIKFAENSDNFQLHRDILWTEAVRKHTRRATALFSKPSDQIVNENLIMKASHSAIWRNMSQFCASIDIREEENRPSRILFSPC